MSQFNYRVNNIIKANKLFHIEQELLDCVDTERKTQLQYVLEQINNIKDKKELVTEKCNAHFELLKNSQYFKKWHTLNTTQQMNRFDEFIERSKITDNQYIEKIKQIINVKQLKTANLVYDSTTGKIINFVGVYVLNDGINDIKSPTKIKKSQKTTKNAKV